MSDLKGWQKSYHSVGHFLASKGAKNEIFSDYENLAKTINELEVQNKRLIDEHQIMRMSYNSLCDDLQNGEHVEMDWIHQAINDAARDRIVGAFNTKIARLSETITKLREALESWLAWEDRQIAKDGPYSGEEINKLINEARTTLREVFGEEK